MSESSYVLGGIFVMALTTYVIRAIPMAVFRKPIKSKFIKSMLYYVPYAVLAAMTFPAILTGDVPLPASIVGTLAAIIAAWFGGSLVQVALAAAACSYIVGLFC